ncbi:hypothetical protein [Streptomyces sp. NPDC012510]|uniref:hypothetical protein n=1 Tax=Streptomyces sp. NPDC012510 TaxID=3364838 RepID=UPI0036E6C43A
MNRGEDPYRAARPPWEGWPSAETSRRRWRIALIVPLVGAAGCGLLFFLGVGAMALLLVVSRLSVPIPDGEPLALSTAEVTGSWVDEQGERLVLKEDGTFTSGGICGDFGEAGEEAPGATIAPDPGAGTWEHGVSDDIDTGDPWSEVSITFTPSGVSTEYETRGTSKQNAVLWMYLGDPDAGNLCVLHKATE